MNLIKLAALSAIVWSQCVQAVGLEPLPPGIPTTSSTRAACFLAGELDDYDANIPRVAVSGCATGVIQPTSVVTSYYVYNSTGYIYDCQKLRANEFNSRYLNKFVGELTSMADSTGNSPGAENVQCVVNSLHEWATNDGMMWLDPNGDVNQEKYDRMWAMSGVAASYFKHDHVQRRAAGQPVNYKGQAIKKDLEVRLWLNSLGTQGKNEMLWTRDHPATPDSRPTNIQYWRAFSTLPIALLNADLPMFEVSRDMFARGMAEVDVGFNPIEDDRGFLYAELGRGTKAIIYHDMAAKPLLAMAKMSQAYGCDFLAAPLVEVNQLPRLVRKTIQGYYNEQVFTNAIALRWGIPNVSQEDSDSRTLSYLLNQTSADAYNNMASFLQRTQGTSPSSTYGAGSADSRLGGRYDKLSASVNRFKLLQLPGFSGYCN